MKDISILIPTYNDNCAVLAGTLQRQAERLGIGYEIIVADDGSTLREAIEQNRAINQLPHCRYVERPENAGRAAIRNFLATEARYDWLLFIDGDMVVRHDDFLRRYAECKGNGVEHEYCCIVCGGVAIGPLQPGNLRSMYEKQAEPKHTLKHRQQSPYQDFHTANFLVRRELMLKYPFDLRFRHYGYEDVLFGKQMEQLSIPIMHIDNPLSFERFESNPDFVSKTEEGLRTLHEFRRELQGYSRLLDRVTSSALVRSCQPLIMLWHRLFGHWERANLTGPHPSLRLFKLYKLGYFLTLSAKKQ